MLPNNRDLKARLYDLTEERKELLADNKLLQDQLEEARDDALMFKRIAENRAETISRLTRELREIKNTNCLSLQDVADEVEEVFRKRGISIF